jgi:hypothetical protein
VLQLYDGFDHCFDSLEGLETDSGSEMPSGMVLSVSKQKYKLPRAISPALQWFCMKTPEFPYMVT